MKVLLLLLVSIVVARECPGYSVHLDYVSELLGWDSKSGTFPCMYASQLLLLEGSNKHLFYWLFRHEEETDDNHKPLVVWMNGGPGYSSIGGLFVENGPLELTKPDKSIVLKYRPGSWAEEANLLYIDQPVNVGFSYGDEYSLTEDLIKTDFINFMMKFFKEHLEFETNDFYLTGESYAGKYIPNLVEAILDHNKQS